MCHNIFLILLPLYYQQKCTYIFLFVLETHNRFLSMSTVIDDDDDVDDDNDNDDDCNLQLV